MESQNSEILISCEEEEDPILLGTVKEIVEKADNADIEGEYFLVPDVQERPETEEIQVIVKENEITSMHQMCRTCATTNGHLIPIFKEEGLEHDLCSKIHKYLPIRVAKNDTLPLQLCYHCAATLLAFNELSEGCLDAQSQLLRLQEQIEQQGSQSCQEEEEEEEEEEEDEEEEELEKVDQTEEKPTVGVKLDNRELSKEEQQHEYSKRDEIKDVEVSNIERSCRAQTSFKVFLDTQCMFGKPLKRRNDVTDKKSSDSSIDPDSLWVDVTQNAPILEHQTSSVDDSNNEQLRKKHQHQEEFQFISEITTNSDDEEFSWKCRTCAREFHSAVELNNHAKVHVSTESYRCDECGRGFKLKDSYLRHSRIHKNERPFTCHICGKQFRDSGGLSRHLKDVHAKLKNFPCDLCDSSFASKATRDDHRRTHTGERPYICDCCGKTFKSKASLYIHSKLHTNEFPHPCSYCSKKFRRRQEMLAHVTTHTGEKNYACDICSKRFRVKSELMRHRLVHSDDKPFICTKCGLAFRQKRYLNNHLKTRHIEFLRN